MKVPSPESGFKGNIRTGSAGPYSTPVNGTLWDSCLNLLIVAIDLAALHYEPYAFKFSYVT